MPKDSAEAKRAAVHRMVMPDHVCPYGIKSVDLLERHGYAVDDRPLTSREEVEGFKAEHGVKTTPQTFVGGRRIGGYTDLRDELGKPLRDPDQVTYVPVLAIFGASLAMAASLSLFIYGTLLTVRLPEMFVAMAMVFLGVQKLRDVESFSTMFLNYDLLGRRWVRYAYAYPWIETGAGVLMLGRLAPWLSVPAALFIGTVGAVSVFKAVYVDKRDLRCACVGGGSNVPLGFVSLTENLAMVGMALWMGARALL
jgi:glutaredoxin